MASDWDVETLRLCTDDKHLAQSLLTHSAWTTNSSSHIETLFYRSCSETLTKKQTPTFLHSYTLTHSTMCLPAEQLRYCKAPTETTIILIFEEIHALPFRHAHFIRHIISFTLACEGTQISRLHLSYACFASVIFQDVFDDTKCTHSFSLLFFWLTSMVLKNNYFKSQLFVHNL